MPICGNRSSHSRNSQALLYCTLPATVTVPLCPHLTNNNQISIYNFTLSLSIQNDVMAESSRSRLDPSSPAAFARAERVPPPSTPENSPATESRSSLALAPNPSTPQLRQRRRRREIVSIGNLWLATVILLLSIAPLPLHSQGTNRSMCTSFWCPSFTLRIP